MTKKFTVEEILTNTFAILGRELSIKSINEDWFVTTVNEERLDGTSRKVAIIDTEKHPTANYKKFIKQSQDAYRGLHSEYWKL